eukprot:1141551-Pelagomonas_calceolata.AAC.4
MHMLVPGLLGGEGAIDLPDMYYKKEKQSDFWSIWYSPRNACAANQKLPFQKLATPRSSLHSCSPAALPELLP